MTCPAAYPGRIHRAHLCGPCLMAYLAEAPLRVRVGLLCLFTLSCWTGAGLVVWAWWGR